MKDSIFDTLQSCQNITNQISATVANLNSLLAQASELGIYVSLNKEEKYDNGKTQLEITVTQSVYSVNFIELKS